MLDDLKHHYGYLFEDELLNEITAVGVLKTVRADEILMDIGETVTMIPLVLAGAIKIFREDTNGDDLLLYFIEQGDTCAMTLTCCLGVKKSEIRAIAETDTTLLMIPVAYMSLWMSRYTSWQNFILQSYHERLTELLEALDAVAFLKLDERLLKYLRDKAMINHNDTIHVTHQIIAQDMHTSRVVISRLLKTLENDKKIELNRNQIKILDL
ncbi:Crp/Fnr family transcriptional regulator [Bizionia gelidisalsuginis]|uniref:Crp/Fnr family transcriptional regulator n=2 Tax=Bizionia TaxID=283785 RepID=A0A8H2LIA6_9FLAO|nr:MULTISPECIES: Crp/Fnr family transcriptional regulator [Bizionia]TYB77282.1 Crp/Fnr family transcriptional regulator [Bizionia saleffrena]TYC18050.1 Crp/Fnr family transcriptional regulator [Bizionia gelidisalsuginis]